MLTDMHNTVYFYDRLANIVTTIVFAKTTTTLKSILQSCRNSTALSSFGVSIILHILKFELICGYSISLSKPLWLHYLSISHGVPDVSLCKSLRESVSEAQSVSFPAEKQCTSNHTGVQIFLQGKTGCNKYWATFSLIHFRKWSSSKVLKMRCGNIIIHRITEACSDLTVLTCCSGHMLLHFQANLCENELERKEFHSAGCKTSSIAGRDKDVGKKKETLWATALVTCTQASTTTHLVRWGR